MEIWQTTLLSIERLKMAKRKTKDWSKIEDYYLVGNKSLPLEKLAEDLNTTVDEIEKRLKKVNKRKIEDSFEIKGGAVSAKPSGMLEDDRATGITPNEFGGKEKVDKQSKLYDKFRTDI